MGLHQETEKTLKNFFYPTKNGVSISEHEVSRISLVSIKFPISLCW